MLSKSTLRTGNDGIQFDFHIYSSPLNALSKMDGVSTPLPSPPSRSNPEAERGGKSDDKNLTCASGR